MKGGRYRTQSTEIPILLYHHLEGEHPARSLYAVSVRQFERQLDVLRRWGFTTIQFRDLTEARAGRCTMPRHPVILTFDDGYASFREYAAPALSKRGMTATTFLVAGEIGGCNRWDTGNGIPARALMKEEHIRETIAAGFEIGSHGWAHRDLLVCSEEEVGEEIRRSREALEAKFAVQVRIFAYPYGRYSAAHYGQLVAAGYEGAVTVGSAKTAFHDDCFAIRRLNVNEHETCLKLMLRIAFINLRAKAQSTRSTVTSAVT